MEIYSGDDLECLVGRVQLTGHPDDANHEWHGLTLRSSTVTTPEVGDEDYLEVCAEAQDNGQWPSACAPDPCPPPDSNPQDPRMHGGRAHAED